MPRITVASPPSSVRSFHHSSNQEALLKRVNRPKCQSKGSISKCPFHVCAVFLLFQVGACAKNTSRAVPKASAAVAGISVVGEGSTGLGIERLWRAPMGPEKSYEVLQVEGDRAVLLQVVHARSVNIIEVDLARGMSTVHPFDLLAARQAAWRQPQATAEGRRAFAALMRLGYSLDYVSSAHHLSRVAMTPDGAITAAGSDDGVNGDWLWRFDTQGAPVERFSAADAGYDPVWSPNGQWLMFRGCTQRGPECDYTQWFTNPDGSVALKVPFVVDTVLHNAVWTHEGIALVPHSDGQGSTCIARIAPPSMRYQDIACVSGNHWVTWSPLHDAVLMEDSKKLTVIRSSDGKVLGRADAPSGTCRLLSAEVAVCDSELIDIVRNVSFPLDGLIGRIHSRGKDKFYVINRERIGRVELVRIDPAVVRSAEPPETRRPRFLAKNIQVRGRDYTLDARLEYPSNPFSTVQSVAWAGLFFLHDRRVPAILRLDLDTGVHRLLTHGPQWDPIWLPDGRLAGLGRNRAGKICVWIDRHTIEPRKLLCVDADDASLTVIGPNEAQLSWEPPQHPPGVRKRSQRIEWPEPEGIAPPSIRR